jgi:hypothetical protein
MTGAVSSSNYGDRQLSNPVGNISTTETSMGLGCSITPQNTGRVFIIMSGMVLNSTAAGSGVIITGRRGTGVAPVNGAISGFGSVWGAQQHFIASTTAGQQGFSLHAIVSGLPLNTTVWFDLSIVATTSGGATIKDISFNAIEI